MFRKLTALLSLVLALAFTTSVAAQDVPALDPSEAEGLESGYMRMYMVDIDAVMATPGAAEAVAAGETPLSGMTGVFVFEDEDMASQGAEEFGDAFAGEFFSGASGSSTPAAEPEKNEVDGLGDAAYEYVGESELDATTTVPTTALVVQEGEIIYVSLIIGGNESGELAQSLAEYMLDGEISDEEVMFSEDGTSTGGSFELMPAEEDADAVGGMIPFMDMDIFQGMES